MNSRHRHRSGECDQPADLGFERRGWLGHQVLPRGWRRSATTTKPMPASNSGSESSMPMVMPPHRKPSWASGSRKQLAERAHHRVADREGADDEARAASGAACGSATSGSRTAPGPRAPPRRAGSDGAGTARPRGSETPWPRARRSAGPTARRSRNWRGGRERARSAPTAQVMSPSDRIGDAALAREQHDREHAAEEAAVERHAAVPHLAGSRAGGR